MRSTAILQWNTWASNVALRAFTDQQSQCRRRILDRLSGEQNARRNFGLCMLKH
uniref:AlNc14C98G5944 protein n=1 Tax=Albugo laibachii Nc14 TaxID=890382 RepID=F0WH77_9STRA|nr:AlNc14C98G5944 [Albugo laibachii Nc14]|eukprot:CCA20592.1 AlNc14C98G5944 [Albugo laibachii Nc14]